MFEVDHLRRRIHARDGRLGQERDALLLVPGEVAHHDLLFDERALQEARQRDAIIERIRLVGDEPDRAGDVVLAQCQRAGGAGDAVADDDVFATEVGRHSELPCCG